MVAGARLPTPASLLSPRSPFLPASYPCRLPACLILSFSFLLHLPLYRVRLRFTFTVCASLARAFERKSFRVRSGAFI